MAVEAKNDFFFLNVCLGESFKKALFLRVEKLWLSLTEGQMKQTQETYTKSTEKDEIDYRIHFHIKV